MFLELSTTIDAAVEIRILGPTTGVEEEGRFSVGATSHTFQLGFFAR